MAGTLVALAVPLCAPQTQPTRSGGDPAPIVSAVAAPAGTESLAAQWLEVSVPGLGVMLAAVARPPGAGPFPTVVLLHGSHGFAHEYVRLARSLARGGLLAIAACWFAGGGGAGSRFITAISCPNAPPRPEASSARAMQTLGALVEAARGLPGAHRDRIGLVGHSRGGGAALNYVLRKGSVQGAVLNSAGYSSQLADLAAEMNAPILILHGTADSPADGGSAFTNVQMARDFEAALKRLGKSVETMYYEGGGHNSIFTSSTQYDDAVQRMVTFFQRHLRN